VAVLDLHGNPVRPPRIVICVPAYSQVPAYFMRDLAQMYMRTAVYLDDGVDLGLFVLDGTYLHEARQRLIQDALAEGATHVAWVDADMRFPEDALVRLLGHGKQAVGINYSQRYSPPDFVALKRANYKTGEVERLVTDENSTGLEEVDVAGMGFFVVRADVLRSLPQSDPWFWFEWSKKQRRQSVGEDAYFCRLLQRAGAKIYVDHDLSKECRHVGTFEYGVEHPLAYRDALAAMAEQQEAA
jgi:hypothetical protein